MVPGEDSALRVQGPGSDAFFNSSPYPFVVSLLSRVQLFATPWTVARQAPLFMGFPRQEYWTGLLFLYPGDFPHPEIKPTSPALAGGFFTTEPPGKSPHLVLLKHRSDRVPFLLAPSTSCSWQSAGWWTVRL